MRREAMRVRFWKKTKWSEGCLTWAAGHTAQGYGAFYLRERTLPAHRIAWELTYGPIPDGLLVCHRCDNPPCVNPAHLFLGTQLDNMRDKVAKGRGARCAPYNPARGERGGNAKITEAQAREILASNEPQRVVAARYGVSQTTVFQIKKRRSWAHL